MKPTASAIGLGLNPSEVYMMPMNLARPWMYDASGRKVVIPPFHKFVNVFAAIIPDEFCEFMFQLPKSAFMDNGRPLPRGVKQSLYYRVDADGRSQKGSIGVVIFKRPKLN
jgi:hypothetical protein